MVRFSKVDCCIHSLINIRWLLHILYLKNGIMKTILESSEIFHPSLPGMVWVFLVIESLQIHGKLLNTFTGFLLTVAKLSPHSLPLFYCVVLVGEPVD